VFRRVFVSSLILGGILFLIAIYLPSFTKYQELKRKDEDLAQKIQELQDRNEALSLEAQLLQSDVKYLEKVLREDLGLVKPGEVVYRVVSEKEESVSGDYRQ